MKGNLSINSENIFPIIKKWLYSDHDIFYRELISNGCDAITKLKKLDMIGEYTLPNDYQGRIDVTADSVKKTLTITDNGLGMTADEVEEYINQIAFSGATDFLQKYKDKTNEDQIIGHFGLGFYSAFMVADAVHIDTLSFQEGAKAVHWECDGGTQFEMTEGNKTEVGTTITLFLNEDCLEFCNEYKAKEVIKKYCSFMPTEIYLSKADETEKEPELLNDTAPLWTKNPSECTKEQYLEFYRTTFRDYKEPLFWIHLNMDYPFNLKGILYFPKINTEYDSIEGTIKLYNNQVFIADNIKEVIPEFLMLLKGIIDCPDLPLNVSRSALQNDGFVKKINDYITKKVADKLSGMCKTDKENYEKYWDDISPFIKFGCLKDDKFCEKMTDYILFKNLEGDYMTLPECFKVDEDNTEANEKIIYYVTDVRQQAQYIKMFKTAKMDAVLLEHHIDQPFISQLEAKNTNIKFMRIDADLTDSLKAKTSKKTKDELSEKTDLVAKLMKKAVKKEDITVKAEKLRSNKIASMITVSEESRRMQDMMRMYGGGMDMGMFGKEGETLILNVAHPLVDYVITHEENEMTSLICQQLYDLAKLQHAPLEADDMAKFVARSNEIMLKLL